MAFSPWTFIIAEKAIYENPFFRFFLSMFPFSILPFFVAQTWALLYKLIDRSVLSIEVTHMKFRNHLYVETGILIFLSLICQVCQTGAPWIWGIPAVFSICVFIGQLVDGFRDKKEIKEGRTLSACDKLFLAVLVSELPLIFLFRNGPDEMQSFITDYIVFICVSIVVKAIVQFLFDHYIRRIRER